MQEGQYRITMSLFNAIEVLIQDGHSTPAAFTQVLQLHSSLVAVLLQMMEKQEQPRRETCDDSGLPRALSQYNWCLSTYLHVIAGFGPCERRRIQLNVRQA